jgi:hypothetical protein
LGLLQILRFLIPKENTKNSIKCLKIKILSTSIIKAYSNNKFIINFRKMSIKISDSLIPILLILSKALIKEKLSYLSAHNSMKFAWNESHPLMEASGRDLYHVRASPSRFDTNILITTSSCST